MYAKRFRLVAIAGFFLVWTFPVIEMGDLPPAVHLPAVPRTSRSVARAQDADEYLRVPPGFRIELFADDDLAHDIHSMTLDPQGRVVVSGAGYVRRLIDSNGDGRADQAIDIVPGPISGAQGMFFDGPDLLYVGDGGLLRYRDADGGGRADGDPELLLAIRTGGEHHAHAIRRGPAGDWYLLAGNDSEIDQRYVQGPASFVTRPEAGGLLRLTADFGRCEVYADGFRNAYDFDFGPGGELLVYDSDGERDISLPWYRPTRVFQTVPGSHAGWLSRSWKHPDYFFEMPPVVAGLGRGSPTGVVCYQHGQFPSAYHQTLLVADWTFGRVHAVPLKKNAGGAFQRGRPWDLVTGRGQFGFAPTDLEVGPRGDLFISVGGRGTRGGVYRLSWVGKQESIAAETPSSTRDGRSTESELERSAERLPEGTAERSPGGRSETAERDEKKPPASESSESSDPLDRCLRVPHPLSSWGRAVWLPLAKEVGAPRLNQAALDGARSPQERARAIEILTELFGGLDPSAHEPLRKAPVLVRARAAWSLGWMEDAGRAAEGLEHALRDEEGVVLCSALESLLAQAHRFSDMTLLGMLKTPLGHESRWVRQLAARVIVGNRERLRSGLLSDWESYPTIARRTILLGLVERPRQVDAEVFAKARELLEKSTTPAEWLECLRVLQLAAGDIGPGQDLPPALDGYTSRLGWDEVDSSLGDLPMEELAARVGGWPKMDERNVDERPHVRRRAWEWLDPDSPSPASSDPDARSPDSAETAETWVEVRDELGRVAAILGSASTAWLDVVLDPVTPKSHPTDDLHALLVTARLSAPISGEHRQRVAAALVSLDGKLAARRLNQDSNWGPRLDELYMVLRRRSPGLVEAILSEPNFGQLEHTWLVKGMAGEPYRQGLRRLIAEVPEDPPLGRLVELVQLVGESELDEHREWLRNLAEDHPAIEPKVILALAQRPRPEDRPLFVKGLQQWQPEVVRAGLRALRELPPREDPDERGALVYVLTRWNRDRQEYALRDFAARLLQRNTGRSGQFQTGESGYEAQHEAVHDWVRWLERTHPEVAERLAVGGSGSQPVESLLAEVPWDRGDVQRGEQLYRRKACGLCHTGRSALGPDLTGIAQRFSRRDLFTAIVDPSRDVSGRYATTVVETEDGKIFRGAVIYESVDGVTLATGDLQTVRIERHEIVRQDVSPVSLMPEGLLDDCGPGDYADLLAYLRTLVPPE